MRVPQSPPKLSHLHAEVTPERLAAILAQVPRTTAHSRYLHWEEVRRRPAPDGMTARELWLGLKISRMGTMMPIPLTDRHGRAFQFSVPAILLAALHAIDATIPRDTMVGEDEGQGYHTAGNLAEEAISSSLLEGAITTRDVARELIRTGREPIDQSERMILNNYRTMQMIREWLNTPLTPARVLEFHRTITEGTLKDPGAEGRLRQPGERIFVGDEAHEIVHDPPPAQDLEARMEEMCRFANGETPGEFIHPIVRAIILHFWLAYDHPFVDGNGRTARALFYWSTLRRGYSLFEYLSISTILNGAPIQYARSFLQTETDDNDLTYFILAQADAIERAVTEFKELMQRRSEERALIRARVRGMAMFNKRQIEVLRQAMRQPGSRFTIEGHRQEHGTVYQTARTDLLRLVELRLLLIQKEGRRFVFVAPYEMAERLAELGEPPG